MLLSPLGFRVDVADARGVVEAVYDVGDLSSYGHRLAQHTGASALVLLGRQALRWLPISYLLLAPLHLGLLDLCLSFLFLLLSIPFPTLV